MKVSQDFHSFSKHLADGFQLIRSEWTTYTIILFITIIVILWCNYKWSQRRIEKFATKLMGPPAYPIIGSALQFIGTHQRKRNK